MKILLDEQMPWEMRHYFPGYDVFTTHYMGWDGKVNGELLALARGEFDVLITMDRSIPSQQRLSENDVAVIVVRARSNDFRDLQPLLPEILDCLTAVRRGEVHHVNA